jgi:hypothetical protein
MAFRMFDSATFEVSASRPIRSSVKNINHVVEALLTSTTTTPISACTLELQGSMKGELTCPNTAPTLAIGSTAQYIKTGSFNYSINGTSYNKTTVAAGTVITDLSGTAITGTITDAKYGGINFYINAAGTVRSAIPGRLLTGAQAYDTAAEVITALDAVETPYLWCYIGRAIVLSSGGFTIGTTGFTSVTTYFDAPMPYRKLDDYAFDSTDLKNNTIFQVVDASAPFIRLMVTAATGTGKITARYTPGMTM